MNKKFSEVFENLRELVYYPLRLLPAHVPLRRLKREDVVGLSLMYFTWSKEFGFQEFSNAFVAS